ncbi:hypothetical protein BGZ67_007899, partial [Mortierella alpina]
TTASTVTSTAASAARTPQTYIKNAHKKTPKKMKVISAILLVLGFVNMVVMASTLSGEETGLLKKHGYAKRNTYGTVDPLSKRRLTKRDDIPGGEICSDFGGPIGDCVTGMECCYVNPDLAYCLVTCPSPN